MVPAPGSPPGRYPTALKVFCGGCGRACTVSSSSLPLFPSSAFACASLTISRVAAPPAASFSRMPTRVFPPDRALIAVDQSLSTMMIMAAPSEASVR